MAAFVHSGVADLGFEFPLENLWFGASCCSASIPVGADLGRDLARSGSHPDAADFQIEMRQ
jgi:hypothetical protein